MNKIPLSRRISDIRSAKKANAFFYFLSHSIIFKHFFYDDLPKEYLAKEGIGLTLIIISYLYRFTRKILYFLALALICRYEAGCFLLVFLLLAFARELFTGIFLFSEDDYDLIILMKVNPKDYGRYLLRQYLLEQGIMFALAGVFLASVLEVNVIRVLYWMVLRLCVTYVMQAVDLLIGERRGEWVRTRVLWRLIIAVVLLVIAAVSVFLTIWIPALYVELAGILLVIGAFGAWIYMYNFDKYSLLFKYNLLQLTINGKNKSLVIDGVDYSTINKKLKVSEVRTDKTGFRYLYSLFTSRYRRNIYSSFIIMVVLSLLVAGALLLLPHTALFTDILEIYLDDQFIYEMLPTMFFLMYCFTSRSAKQFTQLCFFQLDRYLINYNFYRTKDAIMANLHMRLRTIMFQNLIIGAILSIGLTGSMLLYGEQIEAGKVIVCFLLPLVLAVFYCFYNITGYYLLQPYSFDGTVVNKAYPIIDGVVYLICYILMEIHIPISLPIMAVITALLAIISAVMYVLVMKRAPRAFRVR
ncbi:MAG: hypothetical protein K6A14_08905 [Erysipelotrichaceae bacterium]|nr:hypothetical protein [Erysipelotrichaceae bacterium]